MSDINNYGDVMNKSNQLQREIDLIENQITELKDLIEKSKSEKSKLEIKKDTIILDDFPIKLGESVITKKELPMCVGTDNGKVIGEKIYSGVVIKVIPNNLGDCLISVRTDIEKGKDGIFIYPRFDKEYMKLGFNTLVNFSLEDFNELFQIVKK